MRPEHVRLKGWMPLQRLRWTCGDRIARGDAEAVLSGRAPTRPRRGTKLGWRTVRRRAPMTYVAPNSVQARDIASIVHPQTNLVQHLEQGPMVVGRGQGCFIYDDSGTEY